MVWQRSDEVLFSEEKILETLKQIQEDGLQVHNQLIVTNLKLLSDSSYKYLVDPTVDQILDVPG